MDDIAMVFDGRIETSVGMREDMSPTVSELLRSLPFSSRAQRWGDEVYFECPFHCDLEDDARQEMDVGEVAYWPDGDAIALFFGRTPASTGDKPRAYSPCNIVGRVRCDARILADVRPGWKIEVRKV